MQIRVGVVDVDISLPGRQQFRFPLNMLDSIQLENYCCHPEAASDYWLEDACPNMHVPPRGGKPKCSHRLRPATVEQDGVS